MYNSAQLPPLLQTLPELAEELNESRCLAAYLGHRLVGSLRTREGGRALHITRLIVAPDLQGQGIGSRLLAAAETSTQLHAAELMTGALSEGNLGLYRRRGYRRTHDEVLAGGVVAVHLRKSLVNH